MFATKPPALVVTRSLAVFSEIMEFASQYGVPVLRTAESTSGFMSALISMLNIELAQRITRHGVLVEVYGEGILILGESGVGKSETAVELVKRGHRLIADDAVELRRVSNRSILGTAPENIRHFIELRGVGIINVARVFGIGAVKMSQEVDLVVELEPWDKKKAQPHGPGIGDNRHSWRCRALHGDPRNAWPQPCRHFRGSGHQQPPEENGL